MTLAVVLALGAAMSFGLASALQHAGAGRVRPALPMGVALLGELACEPRWAAGAAADLLAVCLQTAAVRYGPVTLVAPLLVTGLFAAALIRPLLDRRRPRLTTVLVSAACAGCLAGLLAAIDPSPGRSRLTSPALLGLVVAGLGVAVAVHVFVRRARSAISSAGILAAGAGALMGLSAAPLRVVATGLAHHGISGVVSPAALLLVGLGGGGWLSSQQAFRAGPLPTPLALLTVLEPAAAAGGGRLALHEPIATHGMRAVIAAVTALGVIAAILLLANDDRTMAATAS